jgi:hypothetical protein
MLPAYVRQEVERRLFENGFRDYEGLAQWVRDQGYEISDDSLWRYGRGLQQQLAAAKLTVHQARALAELACDHQASMAQALITVAQQKALATLLEMEQVKPPDLNAIANLTRAAIAQQRLTAEVKARSEQKKRAATKGAQASLPAHLVWRGTDGERSLPGLVTAPDSASAAGIRPTPDRSSPRIAADPRGSRLISDTDLFPLPPHSSPGSSAEETREKPELHSGSQRVKGSFKEDRRRERESTLQRPATHHTNRRSPAAHDVPLFRRPPWLVAARTRFNADRRKLSDTIRLA